MADYKRITAYQTPWKRLIEVYNANPEDHLIIHFTFPRNRMGIEITVHNHVPEHKFRKVLGQFYGVKAQQDFVKTEDIEIHVTRRPLPTTEAPEVDDYAIDEED